MSNIVNLELNEITKFRLDEINKIKDFFNNEINDRKQQINKISKYVAAFNYAEKVFIVLSASFCSLSIASHATAVGIPVGIAGASLTLVFTACMGVVKTLLSATKKKKKKHNKIMMHASTSLSMIEALLSSSLIDFDISHEEFTKIINEKVKYEGFKQNEMKIGQETEV